MKTPQNKNLELGYNNNLVSSTSSNRLYVATQMRKRLVAILLISVGLLIISSAAFAQEEFITTWQTTSDNETITLPASGLGHDYTVDWGDGVIEDNQTTSTTHTYATAGTYTVKVSGSFPSISFNAPINKTQIRTIEQWGDIQWTDLTYAFLSCSNLVCNAIDAPDLSNVTSLFGMFQSATSFTGDLSNWNTSNITNMGRMFMYCYDFNGNIGNWDVSNVTNMEMMFRNATSFNRDLNSWDVGSVENMEQMFYSAILFNGAIGNWDVSSVTNMNLMFNNATVFNQAIGSWNVSAVTNFASMFQTASAFNQDLSNWDVSSATNMSSMFSNAESFNQNINSWDVSNVTDMNSMISGAIAFNKPLDNWDVSNVDDMNSMFYESTSFNQSLASWDISSVTDMTYLLDYTAMSRENYDNTLISWLSLPTLPSGIELGAVGVFYCKSADAKTLLTSAPHNWIIIDEGADCSGPTDILLTNSSIDESNALNDVIGQLSAINNYGSNNTFTLVSGTGDNDNSSFIISGTALQANEVFDYETKSSYSIRLRIDDSNATYEEVFTITVNNLVGMSQSISFQPLEDVIYGSADFDLTATSSSYLEISYESSDESVAVINGSTVTIVGAGSTTITALQSGNEDFSAATSVNQLLTVTKSNQSISLEAISDKLTTDSPFDIVVSTTSGLGLNFSISGPASINGNTLTLDGTEGTVTITATQSGNTNYNAAESVEVTFTVTEIREAQSITFNPIENQYLEAETLTLSATASSGLDVQFELVNGPASLNGNVLSFTGVGVVTIRASQAGNNSFFTAEDVEQSFEIINVTGTHSDPTELIVFPNPTSDYITVKSNDDNIQLALYNMNGVAVMHLKANESTDLTSLDSGLYLLRIKDASGTKTKKIIKQ